MKKVAFKNYSVGQISLLPPSLEELIPEDHLVRVVNQMVDQIDLSPLLLKYKGGGASSYHPRMMLKVLVYAYSEKTYSSRRIAKALRENVNFMWLSGGNKPDHRTINGFWSAGLSYVKNALWMLKHLLAISNKIWGSEGSCSEKRKMWRSSEAGSPLHTICENWR